VPIAAGRLLGHEPVSRRVRSAGPPRLLVVGEVEVEQELSLKTPRPAMSHTRAQRDSVVRHGGPQRGSVRQSPRSAKTIERSENAPDHDLLAWRGSLAKARAR